MSFFDVFDKPEDVLSTVQCSGCDFKFDVYDFELGFTECPSCYSKKLTLLEQDKPSTHFEQAIEIILRSGD